MYGEFLRNLKRSTNLLIRHRDRRGRLRFRHTDDGIPVIGSRRPGPVPTWRSLLVFVVPGLALSAVGTLALFEADIRGWPRVRGLLGLTEVVFCVIALVLVVRGVTAPAPGWIRGLSCAAALLYPACYVLRVLGVM